ncbi:MAG: helix-turn-helix domain-containing protein [Bilophila wadsworthia]
MALYDLSDRLNWQQACEILGCSKTHLYRLVRAGKVPIYGIGKRYRWFLGRIAKSCFMGTIPLAGNEYPLKSKTKRKENKVRKGVPR